MSAGPGHGLKVRRPRPRAANSFEALMGHGASNFLRASCSAKPLCAPRLLLEDAAHSGLSFRCRKRCPLHGNVGAVEVPKPLGPAGCQVLAGNETWSKLYEEDELRDELARHGSIPEALECHNLVGLHVRTKIQKKTTTSQEKDMKLATFQVRKVPQASTPSVQNVNDVHRR